MKKWHGQTWSSILAALWCLLAMSGVASPALSGEQIVAPGPQGGFRTLDADWDVGQFAWFSSPAIAADSTHTVVLEGPNGYRVSQESSLSGNGWLLFVLPPYFDLSTGSFGPAQLTASVAGLGSQSYNMDAPMTPQGVDLGEFLALGMEQFAQDSQTTLDALAGVDTSRASLQAVADALRAGQQLYRDLAAQARDGSVSLGSGSYRQTMDASQIGWAARLLYCQMAGLAEMVEPEGSDFTQADASEWRNWWESTTGRLGAASQANTRIMDLLTSNDAATATMRSAAELMGAGDVDQYAAVALPLLTWINKQYVYGAGAINAFMKDDLTKQDLDQLNQRIGHLETLVGLASQSSAELNPALRSLLGLDDWLDLQKKAVATLKVWRDAMAGEVGGGGEGTPLTQGFWRIEYTYTTTNPNNGLSEDIDGYRIAKFDSNTGKLLNYGSSQDAGTYSLRGNSITMEWDHYWANLPCCFNGDQNDHFTLTGTYDGGASMHGAFTKELPGGCYTNSAGQCVGMPTTTKGWTATYTGNNW